MKLLLVHCTQVFQQWNSSEQTNVERILPQQCGNNMIQGGRGNSYNKCIYLYSYKSKFISSLSSHILHAFLFEKARYVSCLSREVKSVATSAMPLSDSSSSSSTVWIAFILRWGVVMCPLLSPLTNADDMASIASETAYRASAPLLQGCFAEFLMPELLALFLVEFRVEGSS